MYHYIQLTAKELMKKMKQTPVISVPSFTSICVLYGLEKTQIKFSMQNIKTIQEKLLVKIEIYQYDKNNILFPYYAPPLVESDSSKKIFILVDEEPIFGEEMKNFHIIMKTSLIPKVYVCKISKNCNFHSNSYHHYQEHIGKCEKMSKQTVIAKAKCYGEVCNPVEKLILSGYIPSEARTFRKTIFISFDIECSEVLTNNTPQKTTIIAFHKLLSIAIGTNTGFKSSNSTCFLNPHAPDRYTPSRARCAKSCGAVYTHR